MHLAPTRRQGCEFFAEPGIGLYLGTWVRISQLGMVLGMAWGIAYCIDILSYVSRIVCFSNECFCLFTVMAELRTGEIRLGNSPCYMSLSYYC